MHAAHATEQLAEIAHDLWRDDMEHKGWVPGAVYDPNSKHHDALVPFSDIDKHDRRQALLGITALELESDLIGSIWYERGPARCFTFEEMHKGFKVGVNTMGKPPAPDTPPMPGEIIAWEVDQEGFLCSVTVNWPDGSRSAHHPAARELTRYGESDPDQARGA